MLVWLIEKRKDVGLSQKDVAVKAGIDRSAYCNIERGNRRPSIDVAKKIELILGIPWTRFYEDEQK